MISPTQLMKRLGVGGGLVPFFKCVCVYFVAASDAAPSAAAVAAKCAPVLCLMLFVLLHRPRPRPAQEWYARRIAAGLALSALGDALLVWPQHFVAGMAAFGAAHIAYIAAFRFRPLALHLAVVLYFATALFLLVLEPPGLLAWLVPLYAALLAGSAWRGAARGGRAAGGALLFLASDALLAYSLFGGPLPHKQVLVMSTYYLGQLGIALSVLDPCPAL
ncbi:hypothetical protein ABMA27_003532 [Loxostege sticticalis]|uniref:lysoplasmalogenase n=1 Tax=Loxostege sticticalis TaxID=481309 RepID=A0ABR3HTD9_LOXSC